MFVRARSSAPSGRTPSASDDRDLTRADALRSWSGRRTRRPARPRRGSACSASFGPVSWSREHDRRPAREHRLRRHVVRARHERDVGGLVEGRRDVAADDVGRRGRASRRSPTRLPFSDTMRSALVTLTVLPSADFTVAGSFVFGLAATGRIFTVSAAAAVDELAVASGRFAARAGEAHGDAHVLRTVVAACVVVARDDAALHLSAVELADRRRHLHRHRERAARPVRRGEVARVRRRVRRDPRRARRADAAARLGRDTRGAQHAERDVDALRVVVARSRRPARSGRPGRVPSPATPRACACRRSSTGRAQLPRRRSRTGCRAAHRRPRPRRALRHDCSPAVVPRRTSPSSVRRRHCS